MKTFWTLSCVAVALWISACGKEEKENVEPVASEFPASIRLVVTEEGREQALEDKTVALELKQVGEKSTLSVSGTSTYSVFVEVAEGEKSKQALRVHAEQEGSDRDCETVAYGDAVLELPLVKLVCRSDKETLHVSIFNNAFWNEKKTEAPQQAPGQEAPTQPEASPQGE